MRTLAMNFKKEAARLVPAQGALQNLDDNINTADEIDDIMFRKSEYIGGMATVILAILKKEINGKRKLIN